MRTFIDLPHDALHRVCSLAGGRAILQIASTCTALRPLGVAEALWRDAFEETFRPVLTRWLRGEQPWPQLSWRARYLRFDRTWVSMIFADSGTVLLRLNGRLFDVTAFMDAHPGGQIMSTHDLADEQAFDVGAAFDHVGHSAAAREVLESMLVPPPPGRSQWPTPESCACPETTFAVVSLADNLRCAGARLLEFTSSFFSARRRVVQTRR